MKYVNDKFLPQDEKTVILFGRTGNVLDNSEKHKVPHYAKVLQSKEKKESNK